MLKAILGTLLETILVETILLLAETIQVLETILAETICVKPNSNVLGKQFQMYLVRPSAGCLVCYLR